MKERVTKTWAKTLFELTRRMEELTKDGTEIVSFQILTDGLGYDAVVVLKQEVRINVQNVAG